MKDRLPDEARRVLGAYQRAELRHTQSTVLRETAQVTSGPAQRFWLPSAGELRGIPATGRGVGGAIRGSLPHELE